ncbi:MAG: hypothetical protein C0402_16770 [Thermodesulfovibrio sp.]|nr:hypothetical protein [Thermodesulfovibrio sp.]
MLVLLNLEIARVNFRIQCRQAITLRELPPAYTGFLLNAPPDDETVNFDIELRLNKSSDISAMKKIFDTAGSWSMYRKEDVYCIALDPPALNNKIVWSADFNTRMENAAVYCSDLLTAEAEGTVIVESPVRYPLDQFLLMYILAQRKGMLAHAAGLKIDGKGYLFPGRSGAGKSTLSRQFTGRQSGILSDDRIVVRRSGDGYKIFGTPWPGELGIAENKSLPLSGIFFLHHSEKSMIKELKPNEAVKRLMPVVSIPWYDEAVMQDILAFCGEVATDIPAYELHFRPDAAVVDFVGSFIASHE